MINPTMDYSIRPATSNDVAAINLLLPRLADFPVPDGRNPDDLWQGDRAMLEAWQRGENNCLVCVAEGVAEGVATDTSDIIGVAMVTLREEMLSHEPSAHLEVLALASTAEGRGIGAALLADAQKRAVENGAKSMSLHVFANNTRARALYEREGFTGELLRYFKPL